MKTATKIRRTDWNTYATYGYTHDAANDQASAGGVHHHQIRLTTRGWQKRIVQSNGRHVAYGPTETVSEEYGLTAFDGAKRLSF